VSFHFKFVPIATSLSRYARLIHWGLFLSCVTNGVLATVLLHYCLEEPLWMLYSACGIVWRHLERRRRGSLLL